MYCTASPELKVILEESFGKDFFTQKITERIKSYLDACAELGEKPLSESKFKSLGFTDDEINYRKIKTITKVLNEGWMPDWSNTDQKKWFPWLYMSSSGFVFSGAYYSCSDMPAGLGSRLCFKSRELAEYAGKQFTKLYLDFIL